MLKINRILFKKIKFPLSLRGAKRRSNLRGFSLIELMVAVVILAMAIFGIFHAYSAGFMGIADARDRTVATNYAREEMENLKNMSFDSLLIVEAKDFDISDQIKFSGTKTIKFSRIKIGEEWEEIIDLKKVTIVISWDDRNGIPKEVKLETLIYKKY